LLAILPDSHSFIPPANAYIIRPEKKPEKMHFSFTFGRRSQKAIKTCILLFTNAKTEQQKNNKNKS
jgi:hypothetical protein